MRLTEYTFKYMSLYISKSLLALVIGIATIFMVIGVGAGVFLSQKIATLMQQKTIKNDARATTAVSDANTDVPSSSLSATSTTVVEQTNIVEKENAKQAAVTKKSSSQTVVSATNQSPAMPSSPANMTNNGLSITDIDAVAKETSVEITWNTTEDSDSRLVLHVGDNPETFTPNPKTFVSDPNNGTKHKVVIDKLDSSTKFSFEIVAAAGGKEVSQFSSFSTRRVYRARYAYKMQNGSDKQCSVIVIEDTSRRSLIGAAAVLSGFYTQPGGQRLMVGSEHAATNSDGEIEYCHAVAELKIEISALGYTFQNTASSSDWTVTKPI